MTVKRRFARFKHFSPALLLGLAVACSSSRVSTAASSRTDAQPGPAASVTPSGLPASASATPLATDPDIQGRLSASEVMDGTIAVVTIQLGAKLQGKAVSGEFEGVELPFYPDGEGFSAVLGVPLDHKPGSVSVQVHVGAEAEGHHADIPFAVTSGNYPTTTETLKVDGRLVQPKNPKDLARIKRELAEIGLAYGTVTRKKYWNGPFAYPVKEASYTSSFGKRRVYNGVQTSPHTGLDLKAKQGTPILAASPGKVVLAKSLFFTGNTVILDHGYGVLTLYAHLSKLKTRLGKEVKTGELIGLAGMTGRANGPHLHWMAIIHKQKVNPLGLTQVMK